MGRPGRDFGGLQEPSSCFTDSMDSFSSETHLTQGVGQAGRRSLVQEALLGTSPGDAIPATQGGLDMIQTPETALQVSN